MPNDLSEGAQGLELPPLRSLDDFLLGSARFQLPNIKDFDKWGNRVVKNLIYYQTNYFLIFIIIYAVMLILHPIKILFGFIVQLIIISMALHCYQPERGVLKYFVNTLNIPTHKLSLAVAVLAGYAVLHWLDALLLSSFTFLLPFSVTFVHASLRLRNLKNKVTNTISMVQMTSSTPMGVFLDMFNIAADSLLN